MREVKRRRLEAKGGKIGSVQEFAELKLRLAASLRERRRRRNFTQTKFARLL